jgi:hypothetical protein
LTTASRDDAEFVSAVSSATSSITLNASNYTTYIDTANPETKISFRKRTSGETTATYTHDMTRASNVVLHSNSTYNPGSTITDSMEATLVGYLFADNTDTSIVEYSNNDSSASYRMVYINLGFKSGVTFKPNGTQSFNAKNGTGNWNYQRMYGIASDGTETTLFNLSSPSGSTSTSISNSTFFPQLTFHTYHTNTNSFLLDTISLAGDVIAPTISATGSFEGSTITASSSTSKMGAVITYKDQAGTNALNSDLILKLSADNGSNYSTATLTALPDFSSGVKCCSVADLSVTAGTQLKYKIEFANQSVSKECRVTGVSLQY